MFAYLLILIALFHHTGDSQGDPTLGQQGYVNNPLARYYDGIGGRSVTPGKAGLRENPLPVTYKGKTGDMYKIEIVQRGNSRILWVDATNWCSSPWKVVSSKPVCSSGAGGLAASTTSNASKSSIPSSSTAQRTRASNNNSTNPPTTKSRVSQNLPKRPKVNATHHFLLVTHSQGLKLTGVKQKNRSHTFRRNTLIPVLNYSHTKKRRAGLLGDLVVPDEYKADLLLGNDLRMAVDYRGVMKSGEDYEWRWDSSNGRVTGREFYNQPLRRAFHNLILKFNSGFGFAFLLLVLGVPFAMAAAFGQAVIKEVDAPVSELVAIGVLAGIGIILLWFFGSVIGGWYQNYLDPFEAINAKFAAAGGLVPIQLTSSEIPDGVGFLYYVFNLVYIPYLLFLIFLVVRFVWPVVLTIHYMFVPHPAERSVKSMLRIGETNRSAMDELKKVMNWRDDLGSTTPRWKMRNQTRRMEQMDKKIKAEDTVLDSLLGVLRKKRLAKHLEKDL